MIEEDEDDDEPFIRRRRRRSRAKLVLGLIVGAIVVALLGTAGGIIRNIVLAEERLANDAKTAYDEGNYPLAKQKYDQLIQEYSGSDRMEEYRFFSSLADTRVIVGSVTARDNPAPVVQRFEQFINEFGSTKFAQPITGFGSDIVETGQRVVDTVADNGSDRLEQFQRDRSKNDGLIAAEKAVEEGRRILPTVEKYRDKDAISLEPQRKRFDELQAKITFEKHRLEVLAPFRDIAREPTSEIIGRFVAMLHENNLADDPEARQMLRDAERALRALIGIRRENRPASQPPTDPTPPVLFSAPVSGSPEPRPNPEAIPDVVFAAGRGVLYALDAHTGELLWGTRVAPPNTDPRAVDLPLRVPVGEGGAEWVLMTGEFGGVPGITARVARTGEPVWYQPLTAGIQATPSGALARPLVVGKHVYVPLRDPMGTVVELELFTGTRTGEITIRQPLGGGLAVLPGTTPGVSLLFVPGDAQRIFIFELGREDATGRHLDPHLVRVLQTDHPRDSLRSEPVLITPIDPTGPRYLILSQSDGPTGLKLRAFPLPAPDVLAADHGGNDPPTPSPAEVPIPGWTWFPPVTNGERIVLTTDAGAFLAFGINQLGNQDRPLFVLPGPRTNSEQEVVSRSQVVSAEEDAYWIVLGGQLIRLRTAVDPVGGLRIIPQGTGRPVGDPVHRAQVRHAIGLGVVVARPNKSENVQAVGFDLTTGQIRWHRRLGITPAGPPSAQTTGSWIIASTDGGIYSVTTPPLAKSHSSLVATVVAPPFTELVGRALVASAPGDERIWVLASEKDAIGHRLRIRLIQSGSLREDSVVPLPDDLAGNPLPMGDKLLLPLANGYIYRYSVGSSQLVAGPIWRGESSGSALICRMASAGPDEFLVTDGGRRLLCWKWSGGDAQAETAGGPWEARAQLVVTPTATSVGDTKHYAVADSRGVVYLFHSARPGEPVRRWHGSKEGPIPLGQATGRIATLHAGSRSLLVYCIERRHLTALDPSSDKPAWVARDLPAPESTLAGWTVDQTQLFSTDQTGSVTIVDGSAGTITNSISAPNGSAIATGPMVSLRALHGLLLLDDGSGTIVNLTSRPVPSSKN